MDEIFFKTQKFNVLENEDQETNPHRFGKELANFLCLALKERGYPEAAIFPEDWGWLILCPASSLSLEVACGNVDTVEGLENPELHKTGCIWTCFVDAKIPVLKKIFKNIDAQAEKEKLHKLIYKIISDIPDVKFIQPSELA